MGTTNGPNNESRYAGGALRPSPSGCESQKCKAQGVNDEAANEDSLALIGIPYTILDSLRLPGEKLSAMLPSSLL